MANSEGPHEPCAPTVERGRTDDSLRQERLRSDEELRRTAERIEASSDEAVREARGHVDDALELSRTKVAETLEEAGASPDAMAAVEADQRSEEMILEAERAAADALVDQLREQRKEAAPSAIAYERRQTDRFLVLERAGSDEGLSRVLAELDEAVSMRDEFIALASHELKTPLTPLTLRLQSLAQAAAKEPETHFSRKVNGYVVAAGERLRRLSALIADLLDVSHIKSGKLTMELGRVDLARLIREVVARMRPDAERAKSELQVELVEVSGVWDGLRLEQAVTHLLDNAIKYGNGKPVHVRLSATPGWAKLSVQDEGLGIAADHLPRIFERYERAVSNHHFGGLGLGLYICRTIVESLGGGVSVCSELGRGSTFTLELPCAGFSPSPG